MGPLNVRMPALSATMEDAELLTWLVDVGDAVRSGQPIAEVTTDKVDMELESPFDGTVEELLAEPGTRVALGAIVATVTSEEDDLLGGLDLEGAGGSGATPSPAAEEASAEPAPAERATPPTRIAPAPPPVRKRAKQLGVDLADVTPTGSRGHVTHADLSAFLAARDGGGGDAISGRGAAQRSAPPAAPLADRGRPSPASSVARAKSDRPRRRASCC